MFDTDSSKDIKELGQARRYVCAFIYTYLFICIYIYIYMYIHICIQENIVKLEGINMYLCTYIHICIYIYIYLYISIYIYTFYRHKIYI
jgi:hypothetical protein